MTRSSILVRSSWARLMASRQRVDWMAWSFTTEEVRLADPSPSLIHTSVMLYLGRHIYIRQPLTTIFSDNHPTSLSTNSFVWSISC